MASGYHILGSTFNAVESRVAAISHRVGPWMWIFTLAGFGLSVWDKIQVAKVVRKYH